MNNNERKFTHPNGQPIDIIVTREYVDNLFAHIEKRLNEMENKVNASLNESKQFNQNTDKAFSVFVESISSSLKNFEETFIIPLNSYKEEVNQTISENTSNVEQIKADFSNQTAKLFDDFKLSLESYINYVNTRFGMFTNQKGE